MSKQMRTDVEIQKDVGRELGWDTRVSPTEIGVQVKNGVVTLAGNVDNWAKRLAAQKAAHRVPGVLDVANDLVVRLPGGAARSDTEIAEAVRRTLEWDVTVPDQKIQSTVSNGVVTLDGTVEFWTHRADAERAVQRLAGVSAVVNRMEVKPPVMADSADVRSAIERALEQQAEREAQRIEVKVKDGAVGLTGIVHTWREKEAVLGAVRGTRGVREVADHLSVQPYA